MAEQVQLRILALSATPGCKLLTYWVATKFRLEYPKLHALVQQSSRLSSKLLITYIYQHFNIAMKTTLMSNHMSTTGR